jgi:Flp pilus assembly protein TadG
MQRIIRRARRDEGAAAVEFALIAGVLAMLIFGMLQFGLAFFEVQNLRAATREGARIGAVGATDAEIQQRVSDASYNAIPPAEVQVTACPDPVLPSSTVRVWIDVGTTSDARLQDIMSVDIPFIPTISLSPTIEGEFRCEKPGGD